MRRLLITLTLTTVLWCGWWMLGAFAIERGVDSWIKESREQDWQAQLASSDVSGFPLVWRNQFAGISLIQPTTGIRIAANDVKANVPSYWPFAADLKLPNTPITFETPQGEYILKLRQGQLNADLRPSFPVALKELELISEDWQLNTRQGNLLSAQGLRAIVVQDPPRDQTYHLILDVETLTPGDLLRGMLGLASDWPRAFDRFFADISARIEPSSDTKGALLRQFEVREIDVIWGKLSLSAVGRISVSLQGIPDGTLTLLIKNWREAYDIAKESPSLKVDIPLQLDLMLNGLANLGGDPNTLDLTLSFRDGGMFLGPIALGPAPKINF